MPCTLLSTLKSNRTKMNIKKKNRILLPTIKRISKRINYKNIQ